MPDDRPKRPEPNIALVPRPRAGTVHDEPPRRTQSATERDLSGLAAKFKREHERAIVDLAVPHEVEDPVTGQYEGPALDEKREEREPLERIRHLEKKNDALLQTILSMSGTSFATNNEIKKSNAATKRELITRIVIAILAAIGVFFIGKNAK